MLYDRFLIIVHWSLVFVLVLSLFSSSALADDKATVNEQLLQGVKNDDLAQVKAALDKGANINAKDDNGRSALQFAAGRASVDVVKLLLDKGADVNEEDKYNTTALIQAAKMRSCDHFFQMTKKSLAAEGKNKKGKSMFKQPDRQKYVRVLKLLLDNGAEANAKKPGNWTALMWAAERGNKNAVKLLIERGADVNAKNKKGQTILMRAAIGRFSAGAGENSEVLKLLLEKDADIAPKDRYGETALIYSARYLDTSSVESILAKGGDINARSKDGSTVLMSAASSVNAQVVEMLLNKGVVVNTTNMYGDTALMKAASNWSTESIAVVRSLLEKGAEINAKNNGGETALMKAAYYSGWLNIYMFKLLIKKGADINAKNRNGETALLRVAGREPTVSLGPCPSKPTMRVFHVMKLLVDNGADVNAKNRDGETALIRSMRPLCKTAALKMTVNPDLTLTMTNAKVMCGSRFLFKGHRQQYKAIAKLLIDHGADVNVKDKYGKTVLASVLAPMIEVEGDKVTMSHDKGTPFKFKVTNGTVNLKRNPPIEIVKLFQDREAKK